MRMGCHDGRKDHGRPGSWRFDLAKVLKERGRQLRRGRDQLSGRAGAARFPKITRKKILRFTYSEWHAFLAGVRNNEFEVDPPDPLSEG